MNSLFNKINNCECFADTCEKCEDNKYCLKSWLDKMNKKPNMDKVDKVDSVELFKNMIGEDCWNIIEDYKELLEEREEYEDSLYSCENCGCLIEEDEENDDCEGIRFYQGQSFCGNDCFGEWFEESEELIRDVYNKCKVKELREKVKDITILYFEENEIEKVKYYKMRKWELVRYLVNYEMEDRY